MRLRHTALTRVRRRVRAQALAEHSTVPVVVIIEPDSLPNLATNLDDPRCGNAATQHAYTQGITYAIEALASRAPHATLYLDAGHGGWLGSGPHMAHPHTVHLPLGALLISCAPCVAQARLAGDGGEVHRRDPIPRRPRHLPQAARLRHQRGQLPGKLLISYMIHYGAHTTSTPHYTSRPIAQQALGEPCPKEVFQVDPGAPSLGEFCAEHRLPCCDDPCGVLPDYNSANNEHNYVQFLAAHLAAALPAWEPRFLIDTGRNGVGDMRNDCANWCDAGRRTWCTPTPCTLHTVHC